MLPADLQLGLAEDTPSDPKSFWAQISRHLAILLPRKVSLAVRNGDADALRWPLDIVHNESHADCVDHVLVEALNRRLGFPIVWQEGWGFGEALRSRRLF